MIDARDASGHTALMLAVLQDHEAVVRALLEQGADPNIGDAAGITPIAVARQQHQPRMVDALLQAGAH
jgi:ankyrin repeat protein